MNETDIPENVRALIDRHITSSYAVEVLLLLYREPEREWLPTEVAAAIKIAPEWAREQLSEFAYSGLLCETGQPPQGYRYYPASLDVNAAVAALARAYTEAPHTVVAYIHKRPLFALRRVAEALGLRGWSHQ